jgi:exopolysaccharide production protein ExoZ
MEVAMLGPTGLMPEKPASGGADMPNAPARLQALQALRGIAALLVLIFHTSTMTWFDKGGNPQVGIVRDVIDRFGKMGVVIFFVLSGFVITYSVFAKRLPPNPSEFLLRRIVRIYPPYIFYSVIAFLLYFGSAVLVRQQDADWLYLLKSFLLIPAYDADGEFYPVLMVGWTLIFEMYFYLLFFVALCCKCTYSQTVVGYLIIFSIGCITAMWMVDKNAYIHVLGSRHLWFFFSGVLLFGLYRYSIIHSGFFYWGCLLGALLGLALLYMDLGNPVYKHLALLLFATGCIALALSRFSNQGLSGKIADKLSFLGDASYTLYLYHSLAIIVISGIWKRGLLLPPVANSLTSFLLQLVCLVVLMTAISIPLYQMIERPLIRVQNYGKMGRWVLRLFSPKKPYTPGIG